MYGVLVDLLKFLAKYVFPFFSNIFTECMSTGALTNHMKLAMITTVYEGGSRLDISNYRTSISSSNFEQRFRKIVQVRIVKLLNKYNIIYSKQYGFKKINQ